jgi:hypothetical protein
VSPGANEMSPSGRGGFPPGASAVPDRAVPGGDGRDHRSVARLSVPRAGSTGVSSVALRPPGERAVARPRGADEEETLARGLSCRRLQTLGAARSERRGRSRVCSIRRVRKIPPTRANRLESHFRRIENDVAKPVAKGLDGESRGRGPPSQISRKADPIVSHVEIEIRGRIRVPASCRRNATNGGRAPPGVRVRMEKRS